MINHPKLVLMQLRVGNAKGKRCHLRNLLSVDQRLEQSLCQGHEVSKR